MTEPTSISQGTKMVLEETLSALFAADRIVGRLLDLAKDGDNTLNDPKLLAATLEYALHKQKALNIVRAIPKDDTIERVRPESPSDFGVDL